MAINNRKQARSANVVVFAAVCSQLWVACAFDTAVPLENAVPVCVSAPAMSKTLTVPDSIVCTLSVSDDNDLHLSAKTAACSLITSDGSMHPIADALPHAAPIFDIRELSADYGVKTYQVLLAAKQLGLFRGTIEFADGTGVKTEVSFSVARFFTDSFDGNRLRTDLWRPYDGFIADTASIAVRDGKLWLQSPAAGSLNTAETIIGVRSTFAFGGGFDAQVAYGISARIDGMQLSIIASTSPVTDAWHGVGITMIDTEEQLNVEYHQPRGVGTDMLPRRSSGTLRIFRTDSTIQFFCSAGTKSICSAREILQPGPPVYLHLCLTTPAGEGPAACSFDNIRISDAVLVE